MKILKKPLSILLSLVMILSVFTIIPMSASAEEAPTVTLSKWVEATQEDQDEFSFALRVYTTTLFSVVSTRIRIPMRKTNPGIRVLYMTKRTICL